MAQFRSLDEAIYNTIKHEVICLTTILDPHTNKGKENPVSINWAPLIVADYEKQMWAHGVANIPDLHKKAAEKKSFKWYHDSDQVVGTLSRFKQLRKDLWNSGALTDSDHALLKDIETLAANSRF